MMNTSGGLKLSNATSVPSGLQPIHELLTSRGWTNDVGPAGQDNHTKHDRADPSRYTCELTYVKDVSNDDEFRIRTTEDKVTVAVPIANAPYLYASSFKSYFAATEFVGKHLETYENKTNKSRSVS